MKCDICGLREAVVFVHQVGREGTAEVRLCAQCAKSHGVGNLDGDLAGAMDQLLRDLPRRALPEAAAEIALPPCPSCGATLEATRKRGSASCARCWRHFGAALGGPGERYPGRLSVRLERRRRRERDLAALREQLDLALGREEYERAAALRDELRRREEHGALPG